MCNKKYQIMCNIKKKKMCNWKYKNRQKSWESQSDGGVDDVIALGRKEFLYLSSWLRSGLSAACPGEGGEGGRAHPG